MYIDQKGESREDSAIQYIRHNRKKRERIKLKAKIIIGKDEGGNQRYEGKMGGYLRGLVGNCGKAAPPGGVTQCTVYNVEVIIYSI